MTQDPNPGANSFAGQLFAPDPMSRYQHDRIHGAQQSRIPQEIRALMLAVLDDGISCYREYFTRPSRTNHRLHTEAEQWITADDDEGIFSFNNICEALGCNSRQIRDALARWKTNQLANHPPKSNPDSWPDMKRRSRRKEAA